jgi:phosphate transport system substrate-binding protein
LKYVLTDGQKYVSEAGYIKISPEKIKIELAKVQ